MRGNIAIRATSLIVLLLATDAARADHLRGSWLGGGYSPGYGYSRHYEGLSITIGGPGGYFAYGEGPLWYDQPYYGGWHGYRHHHHWGPAYGIYPPTIPAETLYGPQALDRFINGPAPTLLINPAPVEEFLDVGPAVPFVEEVIDDQPRVRVANANARARALRFMKLGDEYFDQQKYRSAYARYRDATKAAPDLFEAYLRQGQAMVASGQYAIAATTFKRVMKFDPNWAATDFRLDDVYGPQKIAKTAHLEGVADAANKEPENADLLLLVGLQLFFDGQDDRARPFLNRAAALLNDDQLHLDDVIEQPDPPELKAQEQAEGVRF